MSTTYVPAVKKSGLVKSADAGFAKYLSEIQKFPILSAEEEFEYGTRFAKTGDQEAAKILVQSHLRLVAKMASKFRNYGLPLVDLVAEGNLGLMQAVKKFDPQKGFRFATYAMWWIRAFMQDYVLRSWSLVKIGTTAAQKKLFFNLHKIKKRLGITSGEAALAPDQINRIANNLNVSTKEVTEMDSRLSQSDTSLNQKVGEEEDAAEMVDLMAANDISQEEIAIENQERSRRETLFKTAFSTTSRCLLGLWGVR